MTNSKDARGREMFTIAPQILAGGAAWRPEQANQDDADGNGGPTTDDAA